MGVWVFVAHGDGGGCLVLTPLLLFVGVCGGFSGRSSVPVGAHMI